MPPPTADSPAPAPIRVLVADDHQMVREGLCAVLSSAEDMVVVGEATNGREAVRQTRALEPDVVLVDLLMPELDGIEATRKIHELDLGVRVLAITGDPDERRATPAVQAGAAGYLMKTAGSAELLEAVRKVAAGGAYLDPAVRESIPSPAPARLSAEPPASGPEALSGREWEVLKLVAHGHTSREIGDKLFISPKTAETHRERIMRKLSLGSRAELVEFAVDRGLMRRRR